MPLKPEQSATMVSHHDEFVKQFVDETGVSPAAATIIWHLSQAFRGLYWQREDFRDHEFREIDRAFDTFNECLNFPRALDAAFRQLAKESGIDLGEGKVWE
jgi:hypothetical protein